MSTNILFVFEGEDTESRIVTALEEHILNDKIIIKCAYASDIYQLYKAITEDEDLDTFILLKERDSKNPIFEKYTRNDFAEIYLFFDYDAHACLASIKDKNGYPVRKGDDKIQDLLSFFNDETEKGKLYISYPMVEAIRHIVNTYDDFKDLKIKCKGQNCEYRDDCENRLSCEQEPHYKVKVSSDSPKLCDFNTYTLDTWKNIIKAHIYKMNYIVNNTYTFPSKIELQINIFIQQLNKYINNKCPMVAVLSAFPIFILDYYGCEKTLFFLSNATTEKYDSMSLLELSNWVKATLENKSYPQNSPTIAQHCSKYLESMLHMISDNLENPAPIFYSKIDKLRKFRQRIENNNNSKKE